MDFLLTPVLCEPWRKIPWRHKDRDLQYVKNYEPERGNVQHLRVLLYGPVGAGKSSFINSVDSVLQGRITTRILADTNSGPCPSRTYKTYKIQKGQPGNFYPFVFNDTLGLELYEDSGVHPDDIKLAMKGHMRDGYTFNPGSKLSQDSQYYNKEPSLNDKAQVLVLVVTANQATLLSPHYARKMTDIRKTASELGIPQLAVITNIDSGFEEIQGNLKNVYRSESLKGTMERFHDSVGIPMSCIFPVKNYHEEIDINDDADSLILSVLRRIIDFGEDFINNMET